MRKYLLATAALLAVTTAASATQINWDFGEHGFGALPNTRTFDAGGFTLTAKGFDPTDTGTALFSKNAGAGETGLGLVDDPSNGNDEISGRNFIQLSVDTIRSLLTNFQFSMNSVTQGEGWAVYGSMDGSPFAFTPLLSSSGVMDNGIHTLAGGWDNYNFFYSGGPPGGQAGGCGVGCDANVLLASFDATFSVPGPLAGAGLPGLLAGVFAMMGLGWKRRQRIVV